MANGRLNLRAGEWVEVLGKEAILATLDPSGCLELLPFMPEMFDYCGKAFQVAARAHKTCDTVNRTGGRRIAATVHLEGLRCDGTAHGGCQASCLIFWKEAWLRRIAAKDAAVRSVARHDATSAADTADDSRVWAAVRVQDGAAASDITYVCQATTLPLFTTPLPWWDVRQYIEDYTSGNVTLWQLIRGGSYVTFHTAVRRVGRYAPRLATLLVRVYDRLQAAIGGVPYPRRWGTVPPGQKTPERHLNLQPGDLVQVKTYDEVLATLDQQNRNRGMYFDAEEVPFCGKSHRVLAEVSRIIDERTGKMLTFKTRSVTLEGVICEARYSDRRMFCPRAIRSFWRDTWLDPVAVGAPNEGGGPASPSGAPR
jgi:hypothetical protein